MKAAAFLLLGALAATTGSAADYPPAGPGRAASADLAFARKVAACLVRRQPVEARGLLDAADPSGFEAARTKLDLAMNICSGQASWASGEGVVADYRPSLLRGLLADAWFRANGVPALSPAPYAAVTAGSDWISPDPGGQVVLRMADCLAAREPAKVGAVLGAAPGSIGEGAAFQTLAASYPACLEQGVNASLTKNGLRLALAAAYDRRSHEPAPLAGRPQ